MYTVVMCMLAIVASPIVMGEWSMAFLLGQHIEYFYCVSGVVFHPRSTQWHCYGYQ